MIKNFKIFENEQFLPKEMMNVDKYITGLDEELKEFEKKVKNKKRELLNKFQNLVGKKLRILSTTDKNWEEIKEYVVYLKESPWFSTSGSLMIIEYDPKMIFPTYHHVKEILEIIEPKRTFSEDDPYGEEDWEE